MSKKVLILKGSKRNNGNTAILADEFERGARDAGAEVTDIQLGDYRIEDCIGCAACQRNGGKCIQNDDMHLIYDGMMKADVIVFASPVYFYSWTATMKRVIDRTFAVEPQLKNKTYYLITTGAAPEEKYFDNMVKSYQLYISCFRGEGNRDGGYVIGTAMNQPSDVKSMPVMEKAYELGNLINSTDE